MIGLSRKETALIGAIAAAGIGAGIAHYAGVPVIVGFAVATVALAGLAWVVSFATEQIGERLGPAATGVLQSTLGNLPEFFVVIFALRAGQTVVAQSSILGSVFANALLVLGLTIVAGGWKAGGMMRFHAKLANDTAILLMMAVFIIVLVSVGVRSPGHIASHVSAISIIGAVLLLAVYIAWLVPYIKNGGSDEPSHGTARVPAAAALVMLAVAGIGSAFVSDWFVSFLTPTIHKLHIPPAFAGLVIVAIAGNAVENVAGIALAAKGQSDLAISVVKNSVSQCAVFLFPALIITSMLFAHHLTFLMAPLYVAALALTAFSVWLITGDGEANVWEGYALIALYVILAALTFYL